MSSTFLWLNRRAGRVRAVAIAAAILLSPGAVAARPASVRGAFTPDSIAAFFKAVRSGNVVEVGRRLDQTPALLTERDGGFRATALHWAAAAGDLPMATLLLERGADPCAKNGEGLNPSVVALRNNRAGIAFALRCPTEPLELLLFAAAQSGDQSVIVQVLDLKPTAINSVDTLGATPLHWAAFKGHAVITAFLLENGADATVRNRAGKTPLDLALIQQPYWFASGRWNAVIANLQRPEWQRPPGSTVVMAARQGDMVVLRRLLRANPALLRVTDPASGGTLLHAAVAAGSMDAVSFLMVQGVDPAALDAGGKTALQAAQDGGRSEIVEMLKKPR
jgi:ankyrin repeat protein